MVAGGKNRWELLERASPRLFLLGGGLIVGHAAIRGIEAFTDITPPVDVFGPAGYLLALVGLLGLYPSLTDRTPKMARVALPVAAVPLAGWIMITARSVGAVAGLIGSSGEVVPGVFFMGHIVAMILTYSVFGVAVLRSGRQPRAVGVLLLMVPVLFVTMVAGAAVIGDVAAGAFVIGSLLAVTHLAVGYSLQTDQTRFEHDTRADTGATS